MQTNRLPRFLLDSIARLAALVPNTRANITRFHGAVAPNGVPR
jgi:hypothetical protein